MSLVDMNKITHKLNVLKNYILLSLRALKLVIDASRKWSIAWFSLLILRGLLPGAIVYTTKLLVDSVAGVVGAGLSSEQIQPLIFYSILMGLLLLAQQTSQRVLNWIQIGQSELVQDEIKSMIHEKAASVDFGFYESSEYFDLLKEADSQSASRALTLLQNVGVLLQNSITFISIAVILATYSIWLPVILFLGTLPALFIVVRYNRIYHDWWRKTTKERRWTDYLNYLFIEPRFAAEMRLYNLGDYLGNQYEHARKNLREQRIKLVGKQTVAGLFAVVQGLVVTGGIMVWMVWRAIQGLASLGDIALFYQAINQGQGLMRSLLNSIGDMYTNSLFIEHLFNLMEIQPNLSEPDSPEVVPSPIETGIHFENVHFQYPGSRIHALEDFNLFIPAGKVVALVGENGAGKTTVTKLLCRLYDPTVGEITIDGTNLKELSLKELRDNISIMFQEPVRYQATARENISLSKIDTGNDALLRASESARAHELIKQLPDEYDTILGKLFPGGVELSGGQWQRIALARAFLREGQIVVLDEPTSFMDSWAENEWMKQFRDLVKHQTALIITHRFTTAMQADIIHVMDKGSIIESGSHQDLLKVNGRYAESWRAQMNGRSPEENEFEISI